MSGKSQVEQVNQSLEFCGLRVELARIANPHLRNVILDRARDCYRFSYDDHVRDYHDYSEEYSDYADTETVVKETIEGEGESVDEARETITRRIPAGLQVLKETIIGDGKPITLRVVGDTMEKALLEARGRVPAGATIMDESQISAGGETKVVFDADTQQSAEEMSRKQVLEKFGDAGTVRQVVMVSQGRKGFLGLGVRPNRYEAHLVGRPVVELTYKLRARVRAEVGEIRKKST